MKTPAQLWEELDTSRSCIHVEETSISRKADCRMCATAAFKTYADESAIEMKAKINRVITGDVHPDGTCDHPKCKFQNGLAAIIRALELP